MSFEFTLGNAITLAGVLLSAFKIYREMRKQHEAQIKAIQEMKTKLDMVYGWFEANVIIHPQGGFRRR